MDAQHLNELRHKAQQYDDVVQALHVCDGGRYRNDTIESLIAAARERDELRKQLDEARKDTERLNWLDCSNDITSAEADEIVNGHRWQGRIYNSTRDAIDAAMSSDAERVQSKSGESV